MLVNNYSLETKISEINEMYGNGNNVDFSTVSQSEDMQNFLDNLVVELLNKAGAQL